MNNEFGDIIGGETGALLGAALAEVGIVTPTPVQRAAIPVVISGGDALVVAETGSGKTYAYLLPVMARVDAALRQTQCFIIAPTKELAAQIYKVAETLSVKLGFNCALTIDGASMARQLEALRAKPRIIVGDAVRLNKLIEMKKLTAHYVKVVVLDEADRLLDGKNAAAVTELVGRTLKERQLVAVSASMSKTREEAFGKLSGKGYTRAVVGADTVIPPQINHYKVTVDDHRDKAKVLRKILAAEGVGRAIIFINTAYSVDDITARLAHHNLPVASIVGGDDNAARKAALEAFTTGRARFLVCSDVAAWGLDLPNVTHVINFDAPPTVLDYQHRAGRAGRMGAAGTVITIAEKNDEGIIAEAETRFGLKILKKAIAYGEIK